MDRFPKLIDKTHLTMMRDRSKIFLIAACVGGTLVSTSLGAADLSIPRKSVASESGVPIAGAKKTAHGSKTRSHAANRTKTQQRPVKSRPQRIVAYNLFGDPVFKLPGAIHDKRQLTPLADGVRSGAGTLPSGVTTMPAAEPRTGERPDDNAGIAFGCQEKPGADNAIPRQVTACYKTQTDKGWKTQTYLSKGFAASKSEWGGGVSIIYAH